MVFHQELIEGVDFVAVIIGLFGIGEVLFNVENRARVALEQPHFSLRQMFPELEDIKKSLMPMLRGSIIGTLVGILPGAGGTTATFISYAVEKKVSKTPERFGQGAVEGLASVEGANNASVPGALIPLLTLGIPGSGGTAIMLGALIMYGLKPGPLLMVESGDVVWATIAGLYAANFFLLLSNIMLIPLFISLMQLIQKRLTAIVAALCLLGAMSINYTTFNVWVVVLFGILGYLFKKMDYPTAPFILSVVLAPLTENYFRQALMLARGHFSVFFTRPISLGIFIIIVGTFLYSAVKSYRKNRGLKAAV
jgi:putative tricarboxylic transport membrane protein